MSSNANAEASTSRVPSNPIKRGRRESRTRADKGREKDDGRLKSPEPSGSLRGVSPRSGAREGGSTARRVRTVPPSAIYEPPTPPSPVHSPLPHPEHTAAPFSPPEQPKKRHRIRYSSSSDSAVDSDDESSDDEPPWWTFTQRGMAKLRAKSLHRNGRDVEQGGSAAPQTQTQGQGHLTEGESGRESGREFPFYHKERNRMSGVFLPSSRRSSRDKEGIPASNTPSSSLKNIRKQSESPAASLSGPTNKLLHPAPIRFSNGQPFFRRSTHRQDTANPADTDHVAPKLKRTKSVPTRPASAPTSPTVEAPSPGMTTLVNDDISSRLPSSESQQQPKLSTELAEPLSPRRMAKRQLTAPNFPKFFRRSGIETDEEPIEALTDTEVIPSTRNRNKTTLSKPVAIPGVNGSNLSTPNGSSQMIRSNTGESTSTPDQGTSTPTRPKSKRRSTAMLRIQLPPPITNRLKDGWHAGSWQDALYGYYEEGGEGGAPNAQAPTTARPPRSRRPTAKDLTSNKGEEDPITPQKAEFIMTGPDDESNRKSQVTPDQNGAGAKNGDTSKKTKSRRQKRYRQALVPPTPSGLGFTPSTRYPAGSEYPWHQSEDQNGNGDGSLAQQNSVEKSSGFNWENSLAQKEAKSQNGKGHSSGLIGGEILDRHDTMATTTATHSTSPSVRRGSEKGWWWSLTERKKRKEKKKARRRQVDTDWKSRYRRMLFLDARVTIWIRLMNLAIVVVSLGLVITIRLELEQLRLPGLMGSSTTLIMSYSCLTILHVLTAIYREYFGKPIGLWGLRSKMLWVCLDLLFVALWSSAMSLATNDLIATPLECTQGTAWWRKGLSAEYSALLNDLDDLSSNYTIIPDSTQIVQSSVSHSLSVTLPSSILDSPLAHEACRRQAGCIALSLLSLLLYGGNMVISLFRIFETVRRTANVSKAVSY
ncbi:uncharacterized protein I303_103060 [Kwoniella dejecticola CBS 10117]|uniref:Uncharacterized protein n=1 Tax=Kwoniella dejecticola CBS 10117 TaxID=1296121 RepID=A0A1A6AAG8_9TREE|nr:uncharacterized protein I303_03080 [Kwoniella dejecticola CBS 10117]OBR87057.1 hypothetical protein I303_03080 [Kwoniella dejecticola CBS 10117]